MVYRSLNILTRGTGALLLYSGLVHIFQPFYFAYSVAQYDLLPSKALPAISISVPAVQITVGCMLMLNLWPREARVLGLGCFLAFFVFQAKILISGESISCGCFGFSSHDVSLQTILLPLICASVLLAEMLLRKEKIVTGSALSKGLP
jgi:hypothetical protein